MNSRLLFSRASVLPSLYRQPLVLRQSVAALSTSRIARDTTTTTTASSPSTTVETKSKLHGSYHWDLERGLSIALLPLCTAPFFIGAGNPAIDMALGFILPIHVHLGLDQVITDYFHKRKVGNVVYGGLVWGLRLVTGLAIYGCWRINTDDVGITETVKRLWTGKVSAVQEVQKPAASA